MKIEKIVYILLASLAVAGPALAKTETLGGPPREKCLVFGQGSPYLPQKLSSKPFLFRSSQYAHAAQLERKKKIAMRTVALREAIQTRVVESFFDKSFANSFNNSTLSCIAIITVDGNRISNVDLGKGSGNADFDARITKCIYSLSGNREVPFLEATTSQPQTVKVQNRLMQYAEESHFDSSGQQEAVSQPIKIAIPAPATGIVLQSSFTLKNGAIYAEAYSGF